MYSQFELMPDPFERSRLEGRPTVSARGTGPSNLGQSDLEMHGPPGSEDYFHASEFPPFPRAPTFPQVAPFLEQRPSAARSRLNSDALEASARVADSLDGAPVFMMPMHAFGGPVSKEEAASLSMMHPQENSLEIKSSEVVPVPMLAH